jgi:peroxiredoxin
MHRFWKRALAMAALVVSASGAAWAQDGVSLGDQAPALEVLEWVKGEAVDLAAQKGKVVVIDFFSVNHTHVPDQVKHLNALQEKHAAAGVKVLALAVEPLDDVKEFVGKHEFKFPVGVDNQRNSIGSFGRPEPPMTVIVDKLGRVAWRGFVANVDGPLEKVIAGSWDIEAAKKTQGLVRELHRKLPTNDPDLIEPAADNLLTQDPANMDGINARRLCFARRDDAKGFREWISKHMAKVKDTDTLNAVAWDLVTSDNLAWREPATALAAAKAAVEASEGKRAEIIDTLARCYAEIGLLERAIAEQKRAIAALAADTDEDTKKQYQTTLTYFETCLAIGKADKTAPPPKAPGKPTPPKK